MRMVTSVAAMQRLAAQWKRSGVPIGLVPTMGYLHQGHVSLVSKARQSVGKLGAIVVSIYVNPTQFAPTEDLAQYLRDLNFGVRVLIAPTVREADGRALSSRNQYLTAGQREQAVALWQAIGQARAAVRATKVPIPASRLKSELKWLIETRPAARVDYIEFFDPA